jgi:flagellar hook-basal body complex protein FliE
MTTSIEMNRMMAQMRAMEQMASADRVRPQGIVDLQGADPASQAPEFSTLFKQAIDHVNHYSTTSSQLSNAYIRGDAGVDITRVMVASQKSSIATQAMVQVRNKLVESYKEIMNMSV